MELQYATSYSHQVQHIQHISLRANIISNSYYVHHQLYIE